MKVLVYIDTVFVSALNAFASLLNAPQCAPGTPIAFQGAARHAPGAAVLNFKQRKGTEWNVPGPCDGCPLWTSK